MDSENSNVADYTEESEHLMYISEVILHLQEYMEAHPVRSPHAIRSYMTIQHGLVPVIKVDCPHDSTCVVNAQGPCGGLSDMCDSLENAFEVIDLELDFEAPSYDCSPDYSI